MNESSGEGLGMLVIYYEEVLSIAVEAGQSWVRVSRKN